MIPVWKMLLNRAEVHCDVFISEFSSCKPCQTASPPWSELNQMLRQLTRTSIRHIIEI